MEKDNSNEFTQDIMLCPKYIREWGGTKGIFGFEGFNKAI